MSEEHEPYIAETLKRHIDFKERNGQLYAIRLKDGEEFPLGPVEEASEAMAEFLASIDFGE